MQEATRMHNAYVLTNYSNCGTVGQAQQWRTTLCLDETVDGYKKIIFPVPFLIISDLCG